MGYTDDDGGVIDTAATVRDAVRTAAAHTLGLHCVLTPVRQCTGVVSCARGALAGRNGRADGASSRAVYSGVALARAQREYMYLYLSGGSNGIHEFRIPHLGPRQSTQNAWVNRAVTP